MSTVKEVGADNFQNEVLQAAGPVVVDFWAEWCGPCRMLAPVVEKVADKLSGQLKVVKCNTDENQEIAVKYGVRGIPNLIFFNNGQVVGQSIGYVNETQLLTKALEVIKSGEAVV